jgi:ATP-binding cassette subfamily B (MDR/TAP) protein 1
VIVKGRVEESGTHDELMAGETYYRRLVEKQEGFEQEEEAALSRSSSRVSLQEASKEYDLALPIAAPASTPHIEFKNVTFAYPSRPHKKVLEGFSLAIQQGETVALVGPSGGGKSTTVGLIERFYDVLEGEVCYLGHDVRSLNVPWYRSQLSYVGQEPTLFNMTIAENIAFGVEGVSRASIEAAARQVRGLRLETNLWYFCVTHSQLFC